MKREIPKHCNDLDRIRALENENKRLEAENKKLKEENKKLKSDLDFVYIEWKILNNDLCVLRKENQILKELIRNATEDIK